MAGFDVERLHGDDPVPRHMLRTIQRLERYFLTRRVAMGDGPLTTRIGVPILQSPVSEPPRMYYTIGFSRREIEDLCALVAEVQSSVPLADRREWPPILGLGNSVVIALTYLRRNRVQWELAETYGFSREP